MKKVLVSLGIVLVCLVVLGALKDQVVKSAVVIGATQVTGAPTQINSLALGLIQQSIRIKGFKMYNPAGFPKEILIDIPSVTVTADLGALLRKKLHLKRIELDLKELNIIKNKEGKLNVDSLKVVEKGQKKPQEGKPAEQMPMQIDELVLNLGKVVYRDYTAGPQPTVQVYDLNIKNKVYKNITSAQQLVTLILTETLKPTAIQSAKVYAASAILGVGFLPAGVAITLMGNDSAKQSFDVNFDKAYSVSLSLLQESGIIKAENKDTGIIRAVVNKIDITVYVKKLTDKTTEVKVSAKRLILPKPEIAKGMLLQISDKLE